MGKQHHYAAIDSHLKTNGRPATFIDFDYQEDGLVCRGQKYPLIKMPWIHGQTLDEFTYENISRADVLKQLVSKWYQAATEFAATAHRSQRPPARQHHGRKGQPRRHQARRLRRPIRAAVRQDAKP